MVGRSDTVTGPYVDRAGVPMTAGGGTELVRGVGRYAGTCGSDVYREGNRALLVHHYYDRERAARGEALRPRDPLARRLAKRRVSHSKAGAPSVSRGCRGPRRGRIGSTVRRAPC